MTSSQRTNEVSRKVVRAETSGDMVHKISFLWLTCSLSFSPEPWHSSWTSAKSRNWDSSEVYVPWCSAMLGGLDQGRELPEEFNRIMAANCHRFGRLLQFFATIMNTQTHMLRMSTDSWRLVHHTEVLTSHSWSWSGFCVSCNLPRRAQIFSIHLSSDGLLSGDVRELKGVILINLSL